MTASWTSLALFSQISWALRFQNEFDQNDLIHNPQPILLPHLVWQIHLCWSKSSWILAETSHKQVPESMASCGVYTLRVRGGHWVDRPISVALLWKLQGRTAIFWRVFLVSWSESPPSVSLMTGWACSLQCSKLENLGHSLWLKWSLKGLLCFCLRVAPRHLLSKTVLEALLQESSQAVAGKGITSVTVVSERCRVASSYTVGTYCIGCLGRMIKVQFQVSLGDPVLPPLTWATLWKCRSHKGEVQP